MSIGGLPQKVHFPIYNLYNMFGFADSAFRVPSLAFIYFWSQNGVAEVREVVKRLPGGRAIHSVRVSAQTEPWRPDSCTGKIVNYDPVSRTFKLAIYGPRNSRTLLERCVSTG